MENRRGARALLMALTAASVVMLALTVGTLAGMLSAAGGPEETAMPKDGYAGEDAMLGMVLIDIADDDAASSFHVTSHGVYVLAVDEQSPAYRAGVRSGDRIVSANGVALSLSGEWSEAEAGLAQSNALVLLLSRGPEERMLTVTLEKDADISL